MEGIAANASRVSLTLSRLKLQQTETPLPTWRSVETELPASELLCITGSERLSSSDDILHQRYNTGGRLQLPLASEPKGKRFPGTKYSLPRARERPSRGTPRAYSKRQGQEEGEPGVQRGRPGRQTDRYPKIKGQQVHTERWGRERWGQHTVSLPGAVPPGTASRDLRKCF